MNFWRSRKAIVAEQLGLKDCGKVERPSYCDLQKDISPRGHQFCNTPLRIGIEKATGARVKYCWRCQEIIERLAHPRTPHASKIGKDGEGNVVPLPKNKSK
ncbi:MAG: hypothetical protein HYT93_02650 [Parcubacteria group bacterium]|nr:hypothetical protein [Parcubacteria group bacterium]